MSTTSFILPRFFAQNALFSVTLSRFSLPPIQWCPLCIHSASDGGGAMHHVVDVLSVGID